MIYFVNQPFAKGLCKGILPYLFTDQRLVLNERVYIYALEWFHRVSDYPVEWHQDYFNHKTFDNLPDGEEFPINAIIGSVDVGEICTRARQIDEGDYVYAVKNARMFVAPFEMEPDEISSNERLFKMMNTQLFVPRVPSLYNGDTELLCPVDPFTNEACTFGHSFSLDLSPSMAKLLLGADGNIKPISKFTLWSGAVANSYQTDGEVRIVYRHDRNDLLLAPKMFPESDERAGAMIQFSCHHPLND